MNITSSQLDNVSELKTLTATATCGIGLLTAIVLSFCMLFGLQCSWFSKKVEKSKSVATQLLIEKAGQLSADGLMNIRFELSGLTVFVYGTAYKAL